MTTLHVLFMATTALLMLTAAFYKNYTRRGDPFAFIEDRGDRHEWVTLLSARGLEASSRLMPDLSGELDGCHVHLYVRQREKVNTNASRVALAPEVWYETHLHINFMRPLTLQFHLGKQTLTDTLALTEELTLGVPELDRALLIQGSNPHALKAILTDPPVLTALPALAEACAELHVRPKLLTARFPGYPRAEVIDAHLELALTTARALLDAAARHDLLGPPRNAQDLTAAEDARDAEARGW